MYSGSGIVFVIHNFLKIGMQYRVRGCGARAGVALDPTLWKVTNPTLWKVQNYYVDGCVFITAVPIIKLFARGEGDIGGHVLRETV